MERNDSRRNALVTAVLLLACAGAGAADPDGAIAGFLDLNGDGRISYEEFVHSSALAAMREMDADKSGHLSPAEAAALPRDAQAPRLKFSDADANGDRNVSLDELKRALGANPQVADLFRELDQDRDGSLSEAELGGMRVAPQIRFEF